jgi:predicted transcriptional regulator
MKGTVMALQISEAAEKYNIKKSTLTNAIKNNKLNAEKLDRGKQSVWHIKDKDIKEFLKTIPTGYKSKDALTLSEIKKKYGVPRRAMKRAIDKKLVQARKCGGGKGGAFIWQVSKRSLLKYLKSSGEVEVVRKYDCANYPVCLYKVVKGEKLFTCGVCSDYEQTDMVGIHEGEMK